MGARAVWVVAGWVALFGYAGGCGSEPDGSPGKGGAASYEVDDEGCPLRSWSDLDGEPCEDETVTCWHSFECSDDETVTLSGRLSCDDGVWRYSHSDDECCPHENYIEAEGEDCSHVGEGISCTDAPAFTCGLAATIVCSDNVWVVTDTFPGNGEECVGAGGIGGATVGGSNTGGDAVGGHNAGGAGGAAPSGDGGLGGGVSGAAGSDG